MDQDRTKQLLTWMDNLISEQQQVAWQLLEMTIPKRQAIIGDDIPGLQQISSQEEQLLARLQELENMRLRVSGELAEAVGKEGPLTAEEMLALSLEIDTELAQALKFTTEEFARTYVQLVEANQQNVDLINDALSHIDNVIMVISGSTEGVTYSSQGELGEVTLRSYLNKKV